MLVNRLVQAKSDFMKVISAYRFARTFTVRTNSSTLLGTYVNLNGMLSSSCAAQGQVRRARQGHAAGQEGL
jgi:hypothetical protein